MRALLHFGISLVLICVLVEPIAAQENNASNTQRAAASVAASASGERVRFTAPSSVVQIRLEVYDSSGRKLFDNEVRGGNVLDWRFEFFGNNGVQALTFYTDQRTDRTNAAFMLIVF